VSQPVIDLRSDTVTRPSPAMRRAIADAEVGDDVLDGDPTTRRLEARTAELLGTERALFFPSGTMANQAAIHTLARSGTEILVHEDAHIVNWEKAGISALAGVQPRFIRGAPRITRATLSASQRDPSRDGPRATLCCLENTHAASGGMVTPLAELGALAAVARGMGLRVHLDGARLWNASTATGTPLAEFAATADLTMVSFSKGLGAPVGSALAGSRELIDEAWEARQRLGGGMRQSGVLAAAALYGLEHNLVRLGDDHENARRFAAIVAEGGDARVVPPDTNIIMVDLPARLDAVRVTQAAAARGVRFGAWTSARLRAVTHLDVTRADVERAAHVLREIISVPHNQEKPS
jgi:threonine aldolase